MNIMHLRPAIAFVSLLLTASIAHSGSQTAEQRLLASGNEPQNWLMYNGNYEEQRYSSLNKVNASNVGRLGLAWSYELDSSRSQESTPLVVDGILYATTSWSKVVALDATTGREIWTFDPKVPAAAGFWCCDVVNRGGAYYDGKFYIGTFDGRLIALDAKTGKQVWSVSTADPAKGYTITGAPRIVKGKIVIGNSGSEFGARGYVSAYDANTGKKVWRFYTVPTDPAKGPDGEASDEILRTLAQPTWFGKFWKSGAGGTVWDSIVYDPELDQIYIGVGNGAPWNHKSRSEGKGDNLFLASIVALDPDTGRYKWHYQETPGESWDYTASQQITLATIAIKDKPHKVLMQAPKNGFFYVIDRTNGKLLNAEKFVPVNWASKIDPISGRPVENPEARYIDRPFASVNGGSGGHIWHPMSYSPKTGLVYIPAQEVPALYENDPDYTFNPRTMNTGLKMDSPVPADLAVRQQIMASFKGRLLAWDPVAQRKAWSVEYDRTNNGGVLSTGGDLVFQGTAAGSFLAYDAFKGRKLWSFKTNSGVIAGPITYAVKGVQYVAVLAGYGGTIGIALEFGGAIARPPGRVLVFKLGGKARLPEASLALPPANVPTDNWSDRTIAAGNSLYANYCARCHGVGTYSSGVLPDLRRSGALGSKEAWNSVVRDGVLAERGMVSFAKELNADQSEAIRAFVGDAARNLDKEERSR